MNPLIPALRITDYEKSKSFYIEGLGFSIDWEHRFRPDYPVFMQLGQNGLRLFLTEHEGDCQPGGLVYMYVDNVDGIHKRLNDLGFNPPQPTDQPWGQREMRAKDPSGNTICICKGIDKQ